jgi:hypothetical protein
MVQATKFLRLLLISVDPEYGPCFTSSFRQVIILRWRLDFRKIWVLLNTYVINISSWQQREGSHFVQQPAHCQLWELLISRRSSPFHSFKLYLPKLSIPQNMQHWVTTRYEYWTGFEKWNKHYWHNPDVVKLLGKLAVCQLVRKFSNFYESSTVYDRVQKSPQIKHMHPAHSFQPQFWIHFNIIFTRTATSTKWFRNRQISSVLHILKSSHTAPVLRRRFGIYETQTHCVGESSEFPNATACGMYIYHKSSVHPK